MVRIGGKVDISVVVGAVVVFTIIGAAIFGAYYFLVYSPSKERLEDAKSNALATLEELGSIPTSRASSAVEDYRSKINSAKSVSEVNALLSEISLIQKRESRRLELLDAAEQMATGVFYSLPDLATTLRTEINEKETLQELQEYYDSGRMEELATAMWREFLTELISKIESEDLVMRRGELLGSRITTKSEALDYVGRSDWETLRELDFKEAEYAEVPIFDVANRTPSIRVGSLVDIYVYDKTTGESLLIAEGATVTSVLYSRDDLAMIAWSLSKDNVSQTYATDVWEALKALAASSGESGVELENYGSTLMGLAAAANVLDFDLNAVYVVRVPAELSEEIIKDEFYLSDTRDVVLTSAPMGGLDIARLSATSKINELWAIGTARAIAAATTYSEQLQAASSVEDVQSILEQVNSTIEVEQKRKELLDKASGLVVGLYYSADGRGDTERSDILSVLLQDLQNEINSKSTLSELDSYEASGAMESEATAAWRGLLSDLLSEVIDNVVVMERGSSPSWHILGRGEAERLINESTYQVLRELNFEELSYVELPISDTLNRTLGITAGSRVNVYRSTGIGGLALLVENAYVSEVVYSEDDLAKIAWSLTENENACNYSTDMWEALKALVSGATSAAGVEWENYGREVIEKALEAGIMDFEVNAIYLVRVPAQATEAVLQYEFYRADADIALAKLVT